MREQIKSMCWLAGVLWLGSITKSLVPLPIPDMIYAMIILFVLLCLKVIPLRDLDRTASGMLSVFAFFFVPAGVGLMESYVLLEGQLFRVLVVLSLSFIFTVLAVAFTIRFVKRWL